MPTLDQHRSSKVSKVLVVGPSGAGKTGLLGSLANAGYRLFIADFDNGLDILRDPLVVKPECHKNIYYRTITDKVGLRGAMPEMPTSIPRFMSLLDKWLEPGPPGPDGKAGPPIDLGGPFTWEEQDVFVLDSLTFMGTAALRYILALAGRAGKPPEIQHWGEAIRIQEDLLNVLYSEQVKCNVVVNAHLTFGDDAQNPGLQKGFPSALGSKLPPKVGRYFNSVILVEKQVIGQNILRRIKTQATPQIELKNPAPSVVPAEMEPDLAKFFQLVRSAA